MEEETKEEQSRHPSMDVGGSSKTTTRKSGRKRKQIKQTNESADQDVEMKEVEEQQGGEEEHSHKRVKQPFVKLDSCSVCLNEFASSSDQLRLLPCLHSLCRSCGIELINRNEQKNTLTCPECQQSHIFDHPNIEKDASILIDRCPTYHQAWNRNERLRPTEQSPAAAAAASSYSTSSAAAASSSSTSTAVSKGVVYCSMDGCAHLATYLCLGFGCGYQCTYHEQSVHLDRPRHMRVSLEEQEKKHQKEELKLYEKERGKQLEAAKAQLKQIQSDSSTLTLTAAGAERRYRDGLKDESNFLDDLLDLYNTLKENHQSRESLFESASVHIREQVMKPIDEVNKRRFDIDYSLNLTERQQKMQIDNFKKLVDLSKFKKEAEEFQEWWTSNQLIIPTPHPMMTLVRDLKSASLLPTLPPDLHHALLHMLIKSRKSLRASRLLYRANWHGWTRDALIRCCEGEGNTLILVKVEGNGFVFGAYIAPAWPAPNNKKTVPDPTLTSFLFSLINGYGHPIRLSLKNPSSAVDLTSGDAIGFGEQVTTKDGEIVKPLDVILFDGGRPGNDSCAHVTSTDHVDPIYSYQLDEESKKSDPGFWLDERTFGGRRIFGANEIEVYQLL